ncbi:MAG: glyoxalase [Porticoccaceae bacterium]|nr:glyoxalase [Porticoccaceae bacterium]
MGVVTAMGGIESISAVTLAVSDMARSLAFYQAMGFNRVYGSERASFCSLQAGEQYLNLSTEESGFGGGWGRVIFYVADVDAVYRNLCDQGLIAAFPPRDASWGERYFHITDPDGHELSFARPLKPLHR